jgi:tetratricopeptide (TPR) repeat protein
MVRQSYRRLIRSIGAVAVFVTAIGASTAALVQKTERSNGSAMSDSWRQIRTPDLIVMGNASDGQLKSALRELTGFRTVLSTVLPGIRLTSSVPTYMVVLRDFRTFERFQPRDARGKRQANVGGYFSRLADANIMVFGATTAEGLEYQTVFHEYTHYIVERNVHTHAPMWLNEGLAEFYSTFRREYQGRTVIGMPSGDRLRTIQGQTFMPLREVVAPRDLEEMWRWGNRISLFYSESWALVHYILIQRRNPVPKPFDVYLATLAKAGSQDDAFRAAFGTDVDGMDKELREYVRRVSFRGLFIDLQPDASSNASSEPMLEADVRQMQGRLLLELDVRDEAQRELDAALKLDPQHVAARISRARLMLAEDRDADAIDALQKVVADASTDASAHLYLGRALARAWRHEEAIAVLSRATRLNGENPSVWLALSEAALALNRDAQANAAFQVAYQLESKLGFHVTRANAAFRVGRNEVAAAAARTYIEQVGLGETNSAYIAFLAAIADWRSGHPDAATAILAAAEKAVQPGTWTSSVLRFLQGRIDEKQFLSMADDIGEKTEAHAYTGFKIDAAGRHDEALMHFRWVADQGAKNYTEYALVKGELARLDHSTPEPR